MPCPRQKRHLRTRHGMPIALVPLMSKKPAAFMPVTLCYQIRRTYWQSQQRRPHLIFVTRCAAKQKRVSLLRKWGHWAFLSTRSTPFWSSMVMMESWKYESTPKRRNGAGVGPAKFVKRNGAGPASAPMRSGLSLVECNQICITINWFSAQRFWDDLDQF